MVCEDSCNAAYTTKRIGERIDRVKTTTATTITLAIFILVPEFYCKRFGNAQKINVFAHLFCTISI
jgi:hypothetical protein